MPLHDSRSQSYSRQLIQRFRQRFRMVLHWITAIATGESQSESQSKSQALTPPVLQRPAALNISAAPSGYWETTTDPSPQGGSRSIFRPIETAMAIADPADPADLQADLDLESLFSQAELQALNHNCHAPAIAPPSQHLIHPMFSHGDELEQLSDLTSELLLKQDHRRNHQFHLQLMVQELQEQLEVHQKTLHQLHHQAEWLRFTMPIHLETDSRFDGEFHSPPTAISTPTQKKVDYLTTTALSEIQRLRAIATSMDHVMRQLNHTQTMEQRLLSQVNTDLTHLLPSSPPTAQLLICQDQENFYAVPVEAIAQVICPSPAQLLVQNQRTCLDWTAADPNPIQVVELSNNKPVLEATVKIDGIESSESSPPQSQSFRRVLKQVLVELYTFSELFNRGANDLYLCQTSHREVHRPYIILLQTAIGLTGLQVERILGQQDLIIRPVELMISYPPCVSGCCMVENNQLALVLNIDEL